MNDNHHLDAQSFQEWQAESVADIAKSHSHIYRECALAMMRVLHLAVDWTRSSEVQAWGVMFAINHALCKGQSMTVIAQRLKVSRATISNAATEFCKAAQIPPSSYMKSEAAQEIAKQSRNKSKATK